MAASRLRIVVSGLIAQYPLGGVTWDYIQYVVGLYRLGHDVYYIEDTGLWPYNPQEGGTAQTADYNVSYLATTMARFGLAERWAYRFPWHSQWFGLDEATRAAVIDSADLVINVSGCLAKPEQYRRRGALVYIDSDPVFTQIKLARGQRDFQRYVDAHDVHFSFGESLAADVPRCGIDWRPTRQPVLLDLWRGGAAQRGAAYTTVMNWSSYKPVEYEGRRYAQKDVELMKFVDLPGRVKPAALEIALNASGKSANAPLGLLRRKGWNIVDPRVVAADADAYRTYLQSSKAEWSVAKNGYVARSGWFSCRSACYLAAGRPVIAQETGFSRVIPVGTGLFAFQTLEEAVAAIREVESDYERHARAALDLAEGYFSCASVLTSLIERAFERGSSAARDRES